MKILVSCVPFDRGKSGISVYIRGLTAALAARGHELTLIVEKDAAESFPGFSKIVLPGFCRRAVFSMLYHLWVLPFRINFRKYDMAIICAANRRAFCRYPVFTAAVVHDLSQYHVDAKYDRLRMFYIRHLLPRCVRKAQAPVAISHSTAADMTEYWHIPAERIRVIPDGLSVSGTEDADAGPWLQNSGITRPFVLYISRLEHPGKNHENLIRAWDLLPPEIADSYDLVLAGASWNGSEKIFQAAAASPRADHIRFPGFVKPELLPALYRRASGYVFPSLFEGFGLSLIEAMHFGLPCCCSETSSLGEIGKGAALLFDPRNPRSIAEALEKLLTDESLREELRRAGKKRAGEFTWENAAAGFTALDRRPRIFGIPCDNVTMARALEQLDGMVRKRSGFAAFVNAHCLNTACRDREYAAILEEADAVWPDGSGVRMAGRILGFPVPENVNGTDMFPLICSRPYRIYMLGAAPGVAETAMRKAVAVGGLLDFVSERIPRAPLWMRRAGLEWCYRLRQEPIRLFRRYIFGNPLFILRLLFRRG